MDVSLIDEPAGDGRIAVDAAIAQEGPVPADILQLVQIDFRRQDFFLVMGGLCQHAAKGVCDEGASPEFQSSALGFVATDIAGFESDSIDDSYIDAIGDCMRALDGSPRIVLRFAEFRFLRRMPADRSWIEEHDGACNAVSRAPSGYHWSQQTSAPILPACVSKDR